MFFISYKWIGRNIRNVGLPIPRSKMLCLFFLVLCFKDVPHTETTLISFMSWKNEGLFYKKFCKILFKSAHVCLCVCVCAWAQMLSGRLSMTQVVIYGTQQMTEGTDSTELDRAGSRRYSSRPGKEHRVGNRKLSSRLGRGRGLEWPLGWMGVKFVTHLPKGYLMGTPVNRIVFVTQWKISSFWRCRYGSCEEKSALRYKRISVIFMCC